MANCDSDYCIRDCAIQLRNNPKKRRDKVYVGCGAGFAGDRPLAALKLLKRVDKLNYLVLECLAERTLADRFQIFAGGGCGYDPRISEWMQLLLPLALDRGVCIITNMGAVDPLGAQEKVLQVANSLGLNVTVALVQEVPCPSRIDNCSSHAASSAMKCGSSTYLGAAPLVECLEKYQPNVVVTSRVADAALFLAPMVYEFGWNWNEVNKLAQGSLAGHLLECGCQLTGGYFMHSSDKYRDISLPYLLDLSLPYAEVTSDGSVFVAKAEASGGVLNFSTCAQQLLYEVGDPCAYITPDVILDLSEVSFTCLSKSKVLCIGAKPSTKLAPEKLLRLVPKECGWKGWGEISYGGYNCVGRAKAAEFLVRTWMDEACPGLSHNIVSYIVGFDSLKATSFGDDTCSPAVNHDIRLRMDGLFELEEQALQFTQQITALYTNGPAGGGGVSTGIKKETALEKELVDRRQVFWQIAAKRADRASTPGSSTKKPTPFNVMLPQLSEDLTVPQFATTPAPADQKLPLFEVAHCRAGDKGNTVNFSVIPHFLPDIDRLKQIITPKWVKKVLSPLLNTSSFLDSDAIIKRDKWVSENVNVDIYEVKGVSSLNVVVHNILDGGVNCSRRIDRHGKTISDIVLCQEIILPKVN